MSDFWLMTLGLSFFAIFWRVYPVLAFYKFNLSPRIQELLKFIPAVVFPAIIFPSTIYFTGEVEWISGKERVLALSLATLVAFWKKNVLVTLVVGLTSLYFLRQI